MYSSVSGFFCSALSVRFSRAVRVVVVCSFLPCVVLLFTNTLHWSDLQLMVIWVFPSLGLLWVKPLWTFLYGTFDGQTQCLFLPGKYLGVGLLFSLDRPFSRGIVPIYTITSGAGWLQVHMSQDGLPGMQVLPRSLGCRGFITKGHWDLPLLGEKLRSDKGRGWAALRG